MIDEGGANFFAAALTRSCRRRCHPCRRPAQVCARTRLFWIEILLCRLSRPWQTSWARRVARTQLAHNPRSVRPGGAGGAWWPPTAWPSP